jgi:hypothetical protein
LEDGHGKQLKGCGSVGKQGQPDEHCDDGKKKLHSNGDNVSRQLEPFEKPISAGSLLDGISIASGCGNCQRNKNQRQEYEKTFH